MFLTKFLFVKQIACDQTFTSSSELLSKNGSFIAPTFLNPAQHVMQCTFTFIGQENERVSLDFDDFGLQGKVTTWI